MKLLNICWLLTIIAFSVFSQENEKGLAPKSVVEYSTGSNRAVVVGISNYLDDKLDLNFADKDALLFASTLQTAFGIRDSLLTLLTNEEATSAAIHKAFKNLYSNAKSGDVIYIFLSGHGDVYETFDSYEGYFLTHEANPERNYEGIGGVYPFARIQTLVNGLTERGCTVNLIMDACRAGFIFEEGAQKANTSLSDPNFVRSVKILSCGPNELSREYTQLEQGVFTHFLVTGMLGVADAEGLDQDYKVTLKDLEDYLQKKVRGFVKPQKQTPVIIASDKFDKVFANVDKNILAQLLDTQTAVKIDFSLLTKSGIQSHSEQIFSEKEQEYITRFTIAFEKGDYYVSEHSALGIYRQALADTLSAAVLEKLRWALSETLSLRAQAAINRFLSGSNHFPPAAFYYQAAKDASTALSLTNPEDDMFEVYRLNSLFLEAYSILYSEDFKEYPKAKAKLVEFLSSKPNAAHANLALGLLYQDMYDYDSAKFYINRAAELIPTWTFPVNALGNLYRTMGENNKAIFQFQTVIAMDTSLSIAYNNLGNVYLDQNRYAQAEKFYRIALQKRTKNLTKDTELNNLGVIYEQRGLIADAERYFRASLSENSEFYWALTNLGNLLVTHYKTDSKRVNEGIEFLHKAIEVQPFFPRSYVILADFYRKQSDTKYHRIADSLYRKSIEISPRYSWAYSGLAYLLYYKSNHILYATSLMDSVTTYYTSDPTFSQRYAEFLLDIGEKEQSKSVYQNLIRTHPGITESYIGYAKLCESKESIQILEKALETNPNDIRIITALAESYFVASDFTNAARFYEMALKIDSLYGFAYSNAAYSLVELGKFQESLQIFELSVNNKTSSIEPNAFFTSLRLKAKELANKGETTLAESLLLSLIPYRNLRTSLLFDLAALQSKINKPKHSLDNLEKIEMKEVNSSGQRTQILKLKFWNQIEMKEYDQAITTLSFIKEATNEDYRLGNAAVKFLRNEYNSAKDLLVEELEYNGEREFSESALAQYSEYNRTLIKSLRKLVQ